jgi:hypothetical protein
VLAVAAHAGALRLAQPRIIAAAYAERAASLNGESIAQPVGEMQFVADPGGIVNAVDRRSQADEAFAVAQLVDVAVGDREGGAEAPRRRLQNLAEVERPREFKTRGQQELLALCRTIMIW